jgi:hypothetical protein
MDGIERLKEPHRKGEEYPKGRANSMWWENGGLSWKSLGGGG